MNHLRLFCVLTSAVGLNLSAGCDTSEGPSPIGDNSAEQVTEWIEINRSRLPVDYDDFVRLPWAYRAGVFSAASPVDRSKIFRTHMERYSLEHPDLTAPQRVVIDRFIELISPQWYAIPHESPEVDAQVAAVQGELERQMRAAFSHDELARMYAPLGPNDSANR